MTQSKHTPGPWRVGITGHAVYQVAAPELRVALCSDAEERGGRRAERANARLIAAAPAYAVAWSLLSADARSAALEDAPEWVRNAIAATGGEG